MRDAEVETVSKAITRRPMSLFACDIEHHRCDLKFALKGARVLVVGAGGTIGSETTLQMLPFAIAQLDLTDISENYLADLIRHIRNLGEKVSVSDIRTIVVDYGSPIMAGFLASGPPYDFVLNFAAQKHVRSERDPFSLLSMLYTNIVKLADFKSCMAPRQRKSHFFSVSTDKAANPVSIMGASKRIMEDVAFDYRAGLAHGSTTSARFANVAFSNGSLLQAFFHRLKSRQPIAVPRDTRRYFVSPQESGELCLLAALLGESGRVLVPNLSPTCELITLEECAEIFLAAHVLEPIKTTDPGEALALAAAPPKGRYPLLLTPLDTGGEKPYEEFASSDERIEETAFDTLGSIAHRPLRDIEGSIERMRRLIGGSATYTAQTLYRAVVDEVTRCIPQFLHHASEKNLDQRL